MQNNVYHMNNSSRGSERGTAKQPPAFNAPGVVIWTIGFLFVAFLVLALMPANFGNTFERAAGVVPLRFLAGPASNGGILGMLAPLVSHMALHAGIMHIFFNSVWLLAFGAPVARRLGAGVPGSGFYGSSLFLSFFMVTGAAGALAYIAINAQSPVVLVGASGGVSGLLGGLIRFAARRPGHFTKAPDGLAPLTDKNVLAWSAVIIVMNIFFGFYDGGFTPAGSSVAWEAHIGGFLFGLLSFPVFDALARKR